MKYCMQFSSTFPLLTLLLPYNHDWMMMTMMIAKFIVLNLELLWCFVARGMILLWIYADFYVRITSWIQEHFFGF